MTRQEASEKQWLATIHYFMDMEIEGLLRAWCANSGERAAATTAVKEYVARYDEEDLLALVDQRLANPNAVHPWVLKKVKEEIEPVIRKALNNHRQPATQGNGDTGATDAG